MVTAENGGVTIPGYSGTVHFSTTDTNASAVVPPDYTFTAADAGVHTFTGATLVTAGNQTITATDTSTSATTGSATISVTPLAASTLTVTAPSPRDRGARPSTSA